MQIYAAMDQAMPLSQVGDHARRAEALGYDGLNVPDALHDGLLVAHEALGATTRLKVATSVLVVFPRSPMIVAVASWDLQAVSDGRFELGIGTQVRGNIVKRYSTPWNSPVPRMREYIQSLRAIFDCFQNGTPLCFEGEHYQFTRLQPFFNPGPIENSAIPIFLGAVGPRMTALAGEVADGHISHPTHTAPRVLDELAIPALARGAERAGRAPASIRRMAAGLIASGRDAAAVERERERIRELLAFLFSTPSYWKSLAILGFGEVGERLHQLSREAKWGEMPGQLCDALLDAMISSGSYDEISQRLKERYRGRVTHLTFPMPGDPSDDARVSEIIASLKDG